MGGCRVTSQTGTVQALPELRAPMAKAPHISMGCGQVPARAGERMWQSSGRPSQEGGSVPLLPKGPGAGAPGSMKHAEISAWDAKGSRGPSPPLTPRKG